MGDARMSSGSEFQSVGASKAKLSPELPNISKIPQVD